MGVSTGLHRPVDGGSVANEGSIYWMGVSTGLHRLVDGGLRWSRRVPIRKHLLMRLDQVWDSKGRELDVFFYCSCFDSDLDRGTICILRDGSGAIDRVSINMIHVGAIRLVFSVAAGGPVGSGAAAAVT